ncbi:hypothetical protein [[Eubacterium] cellulosolvens]
MAQRSGFGIVIVLAVLLIGVLLVIPEMSGITAGTGTSYRRRISFRLFHTIPYITQARCTQCSL